MSGWRAAGTRERPQERADRWRLRQVRRVPAQSAAPGWAGMKPGLEPQEMLHWDRIHHHFEPCHARQKVMLCLYSQIHYAPQILQGSSIAGMQLLVECLSCRERDTVLLTRHQGLETVWGSLPLRLATSLSTADCSAGPTRCQWLSSADAT